MKGDGEKKKKMLSWIFEIKKERNKDTHTQSHGHISKNMTHYLTFHLQPNKNDFLDMAVFEG